MLTRYSKTIEPYVEVIKRKQWVDQTRQFLKPETIAKSVSGFNSIQVMGAVLVALFLATALFTVTNTNPIMAFRVQQIQQQSWENGLETLATLESINAAIDELEEVSPRDYDNRDIKNKQVMLRASLSKLNALQEERYSLVKSAKHLKVDTLYTPVYQEMLQNTRSRLGKSLFYKQMQSSLEPAAPKTSANG